MVMKGNTFEVKAIVDEREVQPVGKRKRSNVEYLIEWEGFEKAEASWEPAKNINRDLIEEWKSKKGEEGASTRKTVKVGAKRIAADFSKSQQLILSDLDRIHALITKTTSSDNNAMMNKEDGDAIPKATMSIDGGDSTTEATISKEGGDESETVASK